ncbi:MAG: hypothetical protein AAGB27_05425 [Pseudomonadota bacterium]
MRSLILFLVLLVGTTVQAAPALQTGLNGTWWNPEQDGQGFVIHLIPDSNQAFVAWFTFAPEGGSQLWLTGSGTLDQQPITLELTLTRGGALNSPDTVPVNESWGTAELSFSSCTAGQFAYTGTSSGTITLERLTPVVECSEGAGQ